MLTERQNAIRYCRSINPDISIAEYARQWDTLEVKPHIPEIDFITTGMEFALIRVFDSFLGYYRNWRACEVYTVTFWVKDSYAVNTERCIHESAYGATPREAYYNLQHKTRWYRLEPDMQSRYTMRYSQSATR